MLVLTVPVPGHCLLIYLSNSFDLFPGAGLNLFEGDIKGYNPRVSVVFLCIKAAWRENLHSGFPIRPDTNRALLPQKMV